MSDTEQLVTSLVRRNDALMGMLQEHALIITVLLSRLPKSEAMVTVTDLKSATDSKVDVKQLKTGLKLKLVPVESE